MSRVIIRIKRNKITRLFEMYNLKYYFINSNIVSNNVILKMSYHTKYDRNSNEFVISKISRFDARVISTNLERDSTVDTADLRTLSP